MMDIRVVKVRLYLLNNMCLEEWMFDIINNKRNSIDVDKFDYITRDTYMMNLSYGSFDHQILLKDARVIEN